MRTLLGLTVAAAALMSVAAPAAAQDAAANYPAQGQTVRVLVGFGAGGGTDIAARLLADGLEQKLGGNFIVENFPGGGGLQAVNRVVAAEPDGYTLALTPLPATNMLYLDPERGGEFTLENIAPIAMHDFGTIAVAVDADGDYPDLQSLIAAAKENPGGLTSASGGVLAAGHLALLQLEKAAGVDFGWTPFEEVGTMISSLIGGHIALITDTYSELHAAQEAGDIKIVATLADERPADIQDIPTARESGVDLAFSTNRVLIAPAGTPAEIIAELETAVEELTSDPDYQARAEQSAVQIQFMGTEEVTDLWKGFDETFAPLVDEFRSQQ